jgi:hypothetical protein
MAERTQPQLVDGADEGLPDVVVRALDASLRVQQRIVVSHVTGIRAERPEATPREVVEELEALFLKAVTMAGAAVGGTAAVPGVGTIAALGLGAAEIVAFLEGATLFTLAVAHVHGIDVEDVERRRALVLTVLLGQSGREAVGKAARRLPGPIGSIVAGKLSTPTLRELNSGLMRTFLRRFAARQGALLFGRLAPFGIGAFIGGSGNRLLGRTVIRGAKETFGPPPRDWPTTG